MKKLLLLIVVFMVGCQPSHDMLEAEKAYYAAYAGLNTTGESRPLFELRAQDPSKDIVLQNVQSIIVYAPTVPQNGPLVPQYKQHDYGAAAIGAVRDITLGLAPWGAVAYGFRRLGDAVSSDVTTYNQNVSGQSSGTMRVGAVTPTTAIYSGSGNTITGYNEAVSKPEVVYQPEPLVVPTQVVNPVVVNPVIVPQ